MKLALAALGFINEDIRHNQRVIIDTLKANQGRADLILFGEAFLQGFYGPTFDLAHDREIALPVDHPVINEIREAAKKFHTAISFGFIERAGDDFYSTQLTIGPEGQVMDRFRRVSPGWKEKDAGPSYREGEDFHAFTFLGVKMATALCGDLWYDENLDKIRALQPDLLLWPVYTDYPYRDWNTSIKYDYADRANKACDRVAYVNSYCLDKAEENEIAKGGAAFFNKGEIEGEIPSGNEGILLAEIV